MESPHSGRRLRIELKNGIARTTRSPMRRTGGYVVRHPPGL